MSARTFGATGIVKRFGPVTALNDVSFACARGEIHALLGENGAGKSNAGIAYTISNRGYMWGVLAVDTAADWLAGKKPKMHAVENPTIEITHANVNKLTAEQIKYHE